MKIVINDTFYTIKQGSLRALHCLYYIKYIYEDVWNIFKETENFLLNEILSKKTIISWFVNKYCKIRLKLKINEIINKYNSSLKDVLKLFTKDNIKDKDINGIISGIITIAFNEDDIELLKLKYDELEDEINQALRIMKNNIDSIRDKIERRVQKLNSYINKLVIIDYENKDKYIETYSKYKDYVKEDTTAKSYKDTLDYIDTIIVNLATILNISKSEAEEMTYMDYVKALKADNINRAKNTVDIFMASKGDIKKHIKKLEN